MVGGRSTKMAIIQIGVSSGGNIKHFVGLSTDLKPVVDVGGGSDFIEVDKSVTYIYDTENINPLTNNGWWVNEDPQLEINNDFAMQLADITQQTEGIARLSIKSFGILAIGDGTLRTISSVMPSITLAEVQAMNASATLNNSIDWYVIQKAINTGKPILIPRPSVSYVIDLPLTISSTTNFNISGSEFVSPYIDEVIIKNVGVGTHAFIIGAENGTIQNIRVIGTRGTNGSGSGFFIAAGCTIKNCSSDGNGRYGIEFSSSVHVVCTYLKKINIGTNAMGGICEDSNNSSQKNVLIIEDCYIGSNGYNADGTKPTDATPTTGHGIHLGGGIALSVKGTVIEYNTGAGLHLTTNIYGIYSLDVSGNHFEGNWYTNYYIFNPSGIGNNITSAGNYYTVGTTYASSLLAPYQVVISNPAYIGDTCNIEEHFNNYNTKTRMMSARQGLKMGGELELTDFPWIKGLKSDEALAGGYNCIRLDSTTSSSSEIDTFATFIDPRYTYRVLYEYRYKRSASASATMFFYQLDKTKQTNLGAISMGGMTADDAWHTVDSGINAGAFNSSTKYLQMALMFGADPDVNDYLLIRRVVIYKVDGIVLTSGTTANRPSGGIINGYTYYDSTLKKPITWNSADGNWKDAMANVV